jgi:hypothetical protein
MEANSCPLNPRSTKVTNTRTIQYKFNYLCPMPKHQPKRPIVPSALEHENTGTFSVGDKQYKVVGFDCDRNMAIVKNSDGQYKELTNQQVERMRV